MKRVIALITFTFISIIPVSAQRGIWDGHTTLKVIKGAPSEEKADYFVSQYTQMLNQIKALKKCCNNVTIIKLEKHIKSRLNEIPILLKEGKLSSQKTEYLYNETLKLKNRIRYIRKSCQIR